jgi:hypothetical protein
LAPEIERGVNARKRRVAALPCDGKSLTEISATLSTGYNTAANFVPGVKPSPRPGSLIEFAVERKRRP